MTTALYIPANVANSGVLAPNTIGPGAAIKVTVVIDCQDYSGNLLFCMTGPGGSSGNLSFCRISGQTFFFVGGTANSPGASSVTPGLHYFTVEYDSATGISEYYLDGVSYGTDTDASKKTIPDPLGSFYLGQSPNLGTPSVESYVHRVTIEVDGTTELDVDFSNFSPGATSGEDSYNNLFSVVDNAALVDVPVTSHLRLDGSTNTFASCPDIAALAGAMTLDVEVDVALDDWGTLRQTLVNQGFTSDAPNQRSILLYGADSAAAKTYFYTSADATSWSPSWAYNHNFSNLSRHQVGWTWNASVGGSSNAQARIDGVLQGSPVTSTDMPTGLINSGSPVVIGALYGSLGSAAIGNFYSCRIYADGVLVASPDFTDLLPGTTSFTDAQGNLWTLGGNAQILEGDGLPTWNPGFDDDDYFFFFSDLV